MRHFEGITSVNDSCSVIELDISLIKYVNKVFVAFLKYPTIPELSRNNIKTIKWPVNVLRTHPGTSRARIY